MRKILNAILLVAITALVSVSMPSPCHDCGNAFAGNLGFAGTPFQVVKYYAYGAKGSGKSASSPAAPASGNVFDIPAGTLVDNAYVVIDSAVTGTTAINVGDEDAAQGYVDATQVDVTTPGLYSYAGTASGYLAAGAAKYYSAAGKHALLALTGATTAGSWRVVVTGVYLGR